MESAFHKTTRAFLLYPLTWIVCFVIVIAHAGFSLWFQPSILIRILVLIIDCFSAFFWIFLSIKSAKFLEFYNHFLYTTKTRQLKKLLQDCPKEFGIPAQKCIDIIQKINKEFIDQHYRYELDSFIENLHNLTKNHRKLYHRSRTFGTEKQKQHMQSILNQQTDSMKNTMTTLLSFSGNLAILSANVDHDGTATKELQYIDLGLQEVIQEFDDETE